MDVRPAIGEALQSLTFQGCQAADEQDGQVCVTHQFTGVEYQVSGVLALPGALGTGDLVSGECIHTLAAKHRVPVKAGQRIGYVLLIPDAIAAVLRLTVNGVAGDAEDLLTNQRHIVAASFSYLFC